MCAEKYVRKANICILRYDSPQEEEEEEDILTTRTRYQKSKHKNLITKTSPSLLFSLIQTVVCISTIFKNASTVTASDQLVRKITSGNDYKYNFRLQPITRTESSATYIRQQDYLSKSIPTTYQDKHMNQYQDLYHNYETRRSDDAPSLGSSVDALIDNESELPVDNGSGMIRDRDSRFHQVYMSSDASDDNIGHDSVKNNQMYNNEQTTNDENENHNRQYLIQSSSNILASHLDDVSDNKQHLDQEKGLPRHLSLSSSASRNHVQQVPASQELKPISIGLDDISRNDNLFGIAPFVSNAGQLDQFGRLDGSLSDPPQGPKSLLASSDNIDQTNNLAPMLPFGLGPLPQLLGFQSSPFAQDVASGNLKARGDHQTIPLNQLVHNNQQIQQSSQQSLNQSPNAASQALGDQEMGSARQASATSSSSALGEKEWPKIFRFTDGRANLSEFEREKKIRLSKNNHVDNQIDSQVIFDGRPLRRKSFLILHGGILN